MHPEATLNFLVERAAKYWGNKLAFSKGKRNITFRELHDRSKKLAKVLQTLIEKSGSSEPTVAYYTYPNCVEDVEISCACSWIGVPSAGYNVGYTLQDLRRINLFLKPAVLFVSHENLATYEKVFANFSEEEKWNHSVIAIDVPREEAVAKGYVPFDSIFESAEATESYNFGKVAGDTIAWIVFTSGTTADPKGTLITQSNVLASIQALPMLKETDVQLITSSSYAIVARFVIYHAIQYGVTTYLSSMPRGADEWLEIIETKKASILFLFAQQLKNFVYQIEKEKNQRDLSSVRIVQYGGSVIPTPFLHRIMNAIPNAEMYNVYGSTELAGGVLYLHPSHHHNEKKLKSCGISAHHTNVRVVNDFFEDVLPGKTGEIVVKGPSVMKGYLKNPEATQAAFRDGWFQTGDLATVDEDGFVYVLDRKKDVIKNLTGNVVYPSEIDEVVSKHPVVADVATFGVLNQEYGGEYICVAVVLKPELNTETEKHEDLKQKLFEYLRENIARHAVPHFIDFVDSVPRSLNLKILRRVLAERYAGLNLGI